MFPKTGRKIPNGCDRTTAYAAQIAEILQHELGKSHQAHKTLMKWTGANERTAKNWLSGTNGPSGEHLLQLMRHSDFVFECVLKLADRKAVISDRHLGKMRNALQATAELLSEVIEGHEDRREH